MIFLINFLLLFSSPALACPLKAPSELLGALRASSAVTLSVQLSRSKFITESTYSYIDHLTDYYLNDYPQVQNVGACLEQELSPVMDLKALFARSLMQKTLTKLSQSKSLLAQKIATITNNSEVLMFQIFSKELPGTQRIAEVDRSTGVISASPSKIPPNEWPLIFVHEILHRRDETLQSSIVTYNNSENITQMMALLKSNRKWEALMPNEQQLMLDQIERALNRGFLAEFRAWTLTLQVYQEWLEQKEIIAIPWVEEILLNKKENQPLADYIYNYLYPRFTKPIAEGVYASDIWLTAYDLKIKELQNSDKTSLIKKAFGKL